MKTLLILLLFSGAVRGQSKDTIYARRSALPDSIYGGGGIISDGDTSRFEIGKPSKAWKQLFESWDTKQHIREITTVTLPNDTFQVAEVWWRGKTGDTVELVRVIPCRITVVKKIQCLSPSITFDGWKIGNRYYCLDYVEVPKYYRVVKAKRK